MTLRSLLKTLGQRGADRGGARPEPRPFGVNVAGYVASEKGLGEAVRGEICSLRAAGVPVAIDPYVDQAGSRNVVTGFDSGGGETPYRVNLIHINPDQLHDFAGRRTADYFEGRYNIGFWAWELSDFPVRFHSAFVYFDEIWVPSCFVQDAIARVSPVPVVRIPHALAERTVVPSPWPRSRLEVPENAFVFLYMFDFYSVVERKNPLALLEAFRRAFKPYERAWLVLKYAHSEHEPATVQELQRASGEANVRLFDCVLDREDVDGLLATADCYVSPHRSEGFGLTLAESMALGKPVIATAYSGNSDYANESNSFPVRYRLRELDRDYEPYERGSVWAEPDIEHLGLLMRYVVEHPEAAGRVAARGQADVRQMLSPATVGSMMARRLRLIDRFRRAADVG